MRTEKKITARTDDLQFRYLDPDNGSFVPITRKEDIGTAAGKLECSRQLVETLMLLFSQIADDIGGDLKDIWARLDRLEYGQ